MAWLRAFAFPASCAVFLRPLFMWWTRGRIMHHLRKLSHMWKDPCQTPLSPLGNVLCLFQEHPFHFLVLGLHDMFLLLGTLSGKMNIPSLKKFSSLGKSFSPCPQVVWETHIHAAILWLCTGLPELAVTLRSVCQR